MNIDDRIEKCRPTSGPNAHSFADDWGCYERAALVELKRLGITDLEHLLEQAAAFAMDDCVGTPDCKRYQAWLQDSLIWTIARIREHETNIAKDPKDTAQLRYVLRGLLQMSQYHGRLDHWDVSTHDAYSAIQSWLEAKLDPR